MARGKFTAIGAAIGRAIGARDPQVDGSDTLAEKLLPLYYRTAVSSSLLRPIALRKYERLAPGMYLWHNARTKHFDRLLLEEVTNGARQFVLLGAGMDSRAYRSPSS
jgi:methyltransferase (TIGR00027 family)